MNKSVFYFFILMLILASCKNQLPRENGDAKQLVIDPPQLKFAEYSDLIDSVRYVKLELNDDYPISNICKVALHDSLLYVLNGSSNLLVYNRKGKFLFKIAEHGTGPNEYIQLTDFSCNSDLSIIDLFDAGGRKILRYNMYTGEFIQAFSLKKFVYYGMILAENKYLCYDNSTDYFEMDLGEKDKCDIIKKVANSYDYGMVSADHLFKHPNGELGIFCLSDNTIYNFDNGKISPKYTISFKDYLTLADFTKEDLTNDHAKFENEGITLASVKDFDDWIYVRYGIEREKQFYTFLYNKHSEKHYDFRGAIHFPGFMFPYPVAQECIDDCLILTSNNIPMTNYGYMLEHISTGVEEDMLRKILETATDEDNPILQFIYFKKI